MLPEKLQLAVGDKVVPNGVPKAPPPKAGAPNTGGWSTVMLQFPNRPPLVLGAELVSKGAPKGPVDLSPNAGAVDMEGWPNVVLLPPQGCLVLLQ